MQTLKKMQRKGFFVMRKNKILSTNVAILTTKELEEHLEKVATTHVLCPKSSKETYPIPRLLENYSVIKKVYELLNEHVKLRNIYTSSWRMDFRQFLYYRRNSKINKTRANTKKI